jgi:hypothetical protein
MRLAVLLVLSLAGLPAASAQRADDGFSICAFNFQSCVPLTDSAVEARGLSADEKGMVAKLRQLTVDPSDALIEDIATSFGPPRRPGPPDLWFPDQRDEAAQCMDCGLHLLVLDDRLAQINWGVPRRFR